MTIDKLYETLLAGGWILIPIFAVGALAFFILLNACETVGADLFRKSMDKPLHWFKSSLEHKKPLPRRFWYHQGISYKLLDKLLSLQGQNHTFITSAFEIELEKSFQSMNSGLFFVGVLASVAPLLGLYGTVDGMVDTFKTITLYGNSNPVLLADGISEALLTTQSGLLIAFPILLAKNFIDDRIIFIQKQLHKLGLAAVTILEKGHE